MNSIFKLFYPAIICTSLIFSSQASFARNEPIDVTSLSLAQVFDFQFGVTTPFAHLISLQIGNTVIPADISAKHPLTNKKTNIVGAISAFSWKTGLTDPMKLTFHVSDANRKKLLELQKKITPKQSVIFNFQIIGYDPEAKDFYVFLKSLTFPHRGILNKIGKDMPSMKAESLPIQGMILKSSDRYLTISDKPDATVSNPANYSVQMTIGAPEAKQQILVQGFTVSESKLLNWGIIEK